MDRAITRENCVVVALSHTGRSTKEAPDLHLALVNGWWSLSFTADIRNNHKSLSSVPSEKSASLSSCSSDVNFIDETTHTCHVVHW
jgi:hypothetical protein